MEEFLPMNNDIVYIIKESSDPKLVGKKLILEFDAGTYWFEKFILTIFKDRKDDPILYDSFSYIRLCDFLEDNQIELDVAKNSKAIHNRCLQNRTDMYTAFHGVPGLTIFAVSFDKGESVHQSIIEKMKTNEIYEK